LVRVLTDHGAKLTLDAGNGYMPFHWAKRLSNGEVAVELERLDANNRFVKRWVFGGLSAPGGGAGENILANVESKDISPISANLVCIQGVGGRRFLNTWCPTLQAWSILVYLNRAFNSHLS
jgi:hypothetical protein